MKKALNIITKKKLGMLVVVNKKKLTTGIITDGQIRRSNQNNSLVNLLVKNVMTKNPISVDKDILQQRIFQSCLIKKSPVYVYIKIKK